MFLSVGAHTQKQTKNVETISTLAIKASHACLLFLKSKYNQRKADYIRVLSRVTLSLLFDEYVWPLVAWFELHLVNKQDGKMS